MLNTYYFNLVFKTSVKPILGSSDTEKTQNMLSLAERANSRQSMWLNNCLSSKGRQPWLSFKHRKIKSYACHQVLLKCSLNFDAALASSFVILLCSSAIYSVSYCTKKSSHMIIYVTFLLIIVSSVLTVYQLSMCPSIQTAKHISLFFPTNTYN